MDKNKTHYGHPRFYELLDEIATLHSLKNHDYAKDEDPLSNFKEVADGMGLTPFDVTEMFIFTKIARLKALNKKKSVANESIIDTLKDNAVYSLLAIIFYEKQYGTNNEKLAYSEKEKRVEDSR